VLVDEARGENLWGNDAGRSGRSCCDSAKVGRALRLDEQVLVANLRFRSWNPVGRSLFEADQYSAGALKLKNDVCHM